MAINRKGFGAAVAGGALWRVGVAGDLGKLDKEFFVGRVTDIILNSSHPKFRKLGEWNSIGTIFFEAQGNSFIGSKNLTAKPFTPQRSSFPLVNEMVLIFTLPNKDQGKEVTSVSYYYINVISIWNSPHHNAYPNPLLSSDLPPSQQKNYQQTQAGSTRKTTDETPKIPLNSPVNLSQQTFVEQSNIHPLLPFTGDIIYEGRFGNSIRLGSTSRPTPSFETLNSWSSTGDNSNPITIIRNGQPPSSSNEGWVPITEDINKDLSSIYVTSTQKIPIKVSNKNYQEYKTQPISTSEWVKPQVIINSDRLIFNAKTDSILLSAEKSVGLFSNDSLNFQGKVFTVDSLNIKLGDKSAYESIILGDKFLQNLEVVMNQLDYLCDSLKGIRDWPTAENKKGQINANVGTAAEGLKTVLRGDGVGFLDKLESYKSKVSKTK